jgi:hypothetical protein
MGAFHDWLFGFEREDWSQRRIEQERDRIRAVYAALDGPYGSNAELYNSTVRLIQAAKLPDSTKFAKRTLLRLIETCDELKLPYPHTNLAIQMAGVAAGLYAAEGFQHLPPNPALYGSTGYNKALGTIRDILINLNRKAAQPDRTLDILQKTIVSSFVAVIRLLPPLALEDPHDEEGGSEVATIALLDLLPNVSKLIEEALRPLDSQEARDTGLFRLIKDQIKTNVGDKTIDRKASPKEVVSFYLNDTPLEGLFTETQVPFVLPQEQRFAGHWIIAPPGRGKTTLLHSMVLDDLSKEAAVILMDSKGDLIDPIRKLKDSADRMVLIEPDPEHPLALNPLDIPKTSVNHAVSLLEYIFSSLLDAKMTSLQQTLFRSVLPALVVAVPNPTLETFRDLIANGVGAYRSSFEQLPPSERHFFFDKQNGFESKTYQETRNQLVWRLQFLMSNPVMKAMFGAERTKLDIGKEMDAGKVILINNSKSILGEEGAEFFGRFFIALILAATERRSGRAAKEKLPCYVYIDECQTVIRRDAKIATILDECRSQKIGLILAHQRTEQIKDADVLSALSNCAIRYANSDDEAKYLADKLRTTPEFLRSLGRGRFAAFVRDVTSAAVALKIAPVDFSEYAQLTGEEVEAIRQRMRSQYGTSGPPPAPFTPPPPPPPSSTAPPVAVPADQSGPTPSDAPASW